MHFFTVVNMLKHDSDCSLVYNIDYVGLHLRAWHSVAFPCTETKQTADWVRNRWKRQMHVHAWCEWVIKFTVRHPLIASLIVWDRLIDVCPNTSRAASSQHQPYCCLHAIFFSYQSDLWHNLWSTVTLFITIFSPGEINGSICTLHRVSKIIVLLTSGMITCSCVQ